MPNGGLVCLDAVQIDVVQPVPLHILGPIDLTVSRGESVAIIGPSGAGKSTLMLIIGGMLQPSSGRYSFDGRDVGGRSRRGRAAFRAESIGFVFQAAHLVEHRTVLDNVALGLSIVGMRGRERRERAMAQLAHLNIEHLADRRAKLLSGGERQRVALARAVVKRPALVIADEPTGNLDRRTGHAVLDLLCELPGQGITLLLVTHDPTAAARTGRTLRIVDGQIEAG